MTAKRQLKARKTPSSDHPATPPKIPNSIESIYHAVSESVLDSAIKPYADQIVTSQILYHPGLLGIARVTFEGSRWDIYQERDVTRVVSYPPANHISEWEQNLIGKWENSHVRSASEGVSFYVFDKSYDFSTSRFDELQEEFIQYLISSEVLELHYNPLLKLNRKINETDESFYERCLEKARENLHSDLQNFQETMQRQQGRLKERLEKKIRELPESNPTEVATLESNQVEMNAHESKVTIEDLTRQLEELEGQHAEKSKDMEQKLDELARAHQKDIFRLNRGNVKVLRFALVWLPYTEVIIQENESRRIELIKSF